MAGAGCFTTILIAEMITQDLSVLRAHGKHVVTQPQMPSMALHIFLGHFHC